jgi:acetyltransferase-like isoleucine patch superfamily enzyme
VVGRNAVIGQQVTLGDKVRVMDLSFIVGGTIIGARSFIGIGVEVQHRMHVARVLCRVTGRRRHTVAGSEDIEGITARHRYTSLS